MTRKVERRPSARRHRATGGAQGAGGRGAGDGTSACGYGLIFPASTASTLTDRQRKRFVLSFFYYYHAQISNSLHWLYISCKLQVTKVSDRLTINDHVVYYFIHFPHAETFYNVRRKHPKIQQGRSEKGRDGLLHDYDSFSANAIDRRCIETSKIIGRCITAKNHLKTYVHAHSLAVNIVI